jgi:hypothetical protein
MITPHHNIRRRTNGSIDIDFYREQSVTERRAVMTAFLKGAGRVARPLIAVAALATAVYLAPASNDIGRKDAAAANVYAAIAAR